jgi:two-component system chemotaxis response regulator CheB
MQIENAMARMEDEAEDIYKLGTPSKYVCPECKGTLFLVQEGKLIRYRCRVGHGYSPASMAEAHSEAAEAALWTAMRALRERSDLLRDQAKHLPAGRGRQRVLHLAKVAAEQADRIRGIIKENNLRFIPKGSTD